MYHNLVLEGSIFRLRPVVLTDATFIAGLRSDENSDRLQYVHKVDKDPLKQAKWLQAYFDRPGDFYWIIERKRGCVPEGTIGIYNRNKNDNTAEWGRWVLRSGSLAAVESSLLVYCAAFEALHLNSVYCLTVAANRAVISFHNSSGACQEALLRNHFILEENYFDAVLHRVTYKMYPQVKKRLELISGVLAKKLKF
jgi:RimJ/RimL family protein N-acetyltransferase